MSCATSWASLTLKNSEVVGDGCSTEVERTPHNRDGMGSIPASAEVFSLEQVP